MMALSMERLRNLGFLLRDVSRLYAKYFERHAHELNLTLAQCKVLAHLSRNEGISQAQLAELTGTDPMTLVRTLDRMQQDGWVERRPDPADRRAHRLYLRESARPILARMWKISDEARGELLAPLKLQEREQMVELLERLHAHLRVLTQEQQPAVETRWSRTAESGASGGRHAK
jgi:MarR family transcriptional regulator, transcriptional regulator for hemolysin